MHDPTAPESHLLGYRIECDGGASSRYRVIEPEGARVLAVFDARASAERYIVLRELRAIEARPRHPAY